MRKFETTEKVQTTFYSLCIKTTNRVFQKHQLEINGNVSSKPLLIVDN